MGLKKGLHQFNRAVCRHRRFRWSRQTVSLITTDGFVGHDEGIGRVHTNNGDTARKQYRRCLQAFIFFLPQSIGFAQMAKRNWVRTVFADLG